MLRMPCQHPQLHWPLLWLPPPLELPIALKLLRLNVRIRLGKDVTLLLNLYFIVFQS